MGEKGHVSVLFIENREKTAFWAEVARTLANRGYAIHWAVQNPLFALNLPGTVHMLPFPRGGDRADAAFDLADWPILATDRGRQYFGAGHAHYAPYAREIKKVFDLANPVLVIGESTLFHELLAIDEAECRGIAFVHPAGERYPSNRFILLSGASQVEYVPSGEHFSAEEARSYVERIVRGDEHPIYMSRGIGMVKLWRRLRWAATRSRVLSGRLAGERYNTPSLVRKLALYIEASANHRAWTRLARPVALTEQAILYPMHVAPESNIDVWGRPFQDQLGVVEAMLAAAPDDVLVALKSNPYRKYEISSALIARAEREPRLRLLPFSTSMPEAMSSCLGAVTVSGTVGFEAVFGKGRCLSLRHPILDRVLPRFTAASPAEAVRRLLAEPEAGRGTTEDGVTLVQAIYARSFPGLISDPFSNRACMVPGNIEKLANGVEAAIDAALASHAMG